MRKYTTAFLLTAALAAVSGRAMGQFPQNVQSGASPKTSSARITLAIPAIVGVNVGHNFVLDFNSATKCWGSTSTQGTFPQAVSGNTTYTFAVSATSIGNAANVACPGANAQPDIATIQVFSTVAANSRLQASITNGAAGGQATTFTTLIADIFTANRLRLTIQAGDSCGTGAAKVSPFNLAVAAANQVTAIPTTGWVDCRQTLGLTLASTTALASGTATGTLAYTIVNP
jgi:hypothetical protein